MIHGACLGGGLELALACRRRVALASAAPIQVGMPEVHLRPDPGLGGITRIPRLIGPDDGLNLLISGRSIGYLLARSHGIVDRLASDERFDRIARLALDRSGHRTDVARRRLGRGLEPRADDVDEQPGEHPEAQLQILPIVAIDARPRPRGRPRSHRQCRWPSWRCRKPSGNLWPRSWRTIGMMIPPIVGHDSLHRSAMVTWGRLPISSPSPIM